MTIEKIANLGYASQHAEDGSRHELMAVLTRDAAGMCAVYVGIVKLPHDGSAETAQRMRAAENSEWVARFGSKQTYKRATFFFSYLEEKEYRL